MDGINYEILGWITILMSGISILFSFLMICAYFFFRELKTFAGRLMLGISFSNLFMNIILFTGGNLQNIDTKVDGLLCKIFGFLMNVFEIFEASIIAGISACLYFSICKNRDPDIYEKKIWIFLIVFSMGLSILPFFSNGYGGTDQIQCWIKNNTNALCMFYVPMSFIFILIIVSLFKCYRSLGNDFKKTAFLFVFPLIFLIAYIFPILRRILTLFDKNEGNFLFALYYLSYILFLLKGIVDSVAYCYLNRFLKNTIYKYFQKKRRRTNGNLLVTPTIND